MAEFLFLYLPPVVLLVVIGLAAHFKLMSRPSYRGWWGEYKVNLMLKLCLGREYSIISNAIYRGMTREDTTQVDHVVVSRYGIFVLETKCLKGRIIVDPSNDANWLQIVGRRKYRLQNPLRQNYSHVKAVQRITGVHTSKIHSYAVMAGTARFDGGYPERVYGVWGAMRKIQSCRDPVFSKSHVEELKRALIRRRVKLGLFGTRKHVENLQRRAQRNQQEGL